MANLSEWTTVLEVMIRSRRADLAFRTTKQERWNQRGRQQSALTRDPTAEPIVMHVAQQGAVALWRMDFLEAAIQWETQARVELQWMLPPTLPE